MKALRGTGVALVTPFNSDGSIDLPGLERLVNYQIDNGVDYLVVLGTTGETATLTTQEKEMVKQKVVEFNKERLPLVVGVGGNNSQALSEELMTGNFDGYTAVLSVSPYYNKPSQEGIYQHFKLLADSSPLPLILYNVPPRTGSNIAPKTVFRLANELNNIIGIKEAAGDFEQALELIKGAPEGFLVISGEDKLALPLALAGGDGVISVIGQGLPKEFSQLIRWGLEGQAKAAFKEYYQLSESIDLIFDEGNPAGIKAFLEALGICSSKVRLPLVASSPDLSQKINTFVSDFKRN